jgi:hypothetical protein
MLQREYRNSTARQNYPAQPLASAGLTDAERNLAKLCRATFLSTWSYPNVHRAEQRPGGGVIAKEVCDLLVVFEDHVVIFSDKDCVFPASGDVDKDWSRWYRRAIEKSAQQLYGAERVIRARETLYLDASLTAEIPLALPESSVLKVHRVLVAHGACDRCRVALGGSGTLMIVPQIIGDAHLTPRSNGGTPFAVGQINPAKGYVHVLDDAALVLLLRTLDTAADLIAYLSKKEALITSGRLGFAAGEEALLGWYSSDIGTDGEHDFVAPAGAPVNAPIAVDESRWHRFATSPEAARKLEADQVSYLWDHTIELFAHHFRQGTADHLTDTNPESHASILRFFACENRTRRRMLARAIVEMLETTKPDMRRLRVLKPSRPGDPHWVLLLLPFPKGVAYRDYRDARRGYLEACCMVTKLMHPDAQDIVGFATETARGAEGSEDAIYLDAREWSEEMANQARQLQRDLGILVAPTMMEGTEYELPPPR